MNYNKTHIHSNPCINRKISISASQIFRNDSVPFTGWTPLPNWNNKRYYFSAVEADVWNSASALSPWGFRFNFLPSIRKYPSGPSGFLFQTARWQASLRVTSSIEAPMTRWRRGSLHDFLCGIGVFSDFHKGIEK